MSSLKKISKNIFHFMSSHLVSFVFGMVSSIIMARALGPNDLGIFHQVQWFAGTASVIISLGLITSIIKFTAQYTAEGRHQDAISLIRYIVYIEFFIAFITSLALLFLAPRIADHYFSPNQTFIFALSFLAITPGIQTAIFSATLEGAQVFKYQTIHAITITPIALLIKILLMLNGFGLASLFWANLAFSIINLVFYFFAAKREGLLKGWFSKNSPNSNWKKELKKYNRSSIGIHFVDLIVWSRSENYFLGRYCSASQIAYYNLAHNLISKFTGTLPNLMWKILLPLTSAQYGRTEIEKVQRTYKHALRYIAFLAIPTVVACFVSAYELVVIFYGHEYAEAKTCMQIFCIGALLSNLAQPGSAAIYASNRQSFILKYGTILAFLNIGLDIWLIPKYGAPGAAICYGTTTTLGVVGGFIFTTRNMNLEIPWSALLKSSFAALLMGILLNWLLSFEMEVYSIFKPMSDLLLLWTGHDFHILLGARTVRLALSFFSSGLLYLLIVYGLFRPTSDDNLILKAFSQYLPKPILWLLKRKFSKFEMKLI